MIDHAVLDDQAEWLQVGGPGVAWRQTGDEIVVLDLQGSIYFGLNGTGASLWRRLTAPANRADLVEVLRNSGADAYRAAQDVDVFLGQLDGFALLMRAPNGPPP